MHDDLLQPLPLDQRLCHTELIDSVPDRFQGLIDGGILDPLDLSLPQLVHETMGSTGSLYFIKGWKILEHGLNLGLQVSILECDRDLDMSCAPDGFCRNLFLGQ